MTARVIIVDQESDLFEVLAGVKQGRVLASVIFILLVAVTLVFRNGLSTDGSILFNIASVEVLSVCNSSKHRSKYSLTPCTYFSMQTMLLYQVMHPRAFKTVIIFLHALIREPA